MSKSKFSGPKSETAIQAEPRSGVDDGAEQRSIRASRASRLSLLAVVVAVAVAVTCRDEVQFVVGDILSKFQTSPAYFTAEQKGKLKVPDLQTPAVALSKN